MAPNSGYFCLNEGQLEGPEKQSCHSMFYSLIEKLGRTHPRIKLQWPLLIGDIWWFPKVRGTFLVVPIMRFLIFQYSIDGS